MYTLEIVNFDDVSMYMYTIVPGTVYIFLQFYKLYTL